MNTTGNGHYVVDGKVYTDKIVAILEAQRTNKDMSWYFYQDVFSKVNWQIEPELSLQELYRIRAQQIRDRYDYVIVRVSGGADSTNVIWSFLNNGIRVDEIVADAPMSGLRDWNWNKDTSPSNTVSETKFAQFPLLDEIASKFPQIKISVHDYFDGLDNISAEFWHSKFNEMVNPADKFGLQSFSHLVAMAEQGKRIGVVIGLDKPQLRYNADRNIIVSIADKVVNIGSKDPFDYPYPNVDRVLFYYTPDLPELMVKQCHVLSKFMHKKENMWLSKIVRDLSQPRKYTGTVNELGMPVPEKSPKSLYQRSITPIIYPGTWDGSVFQCDKADGQFMAAHNDWFWRLHKNTNFAQMMISEFRDFYKKFDDKYLYTDKTGFKMFSQHYVIGSVDKFLER